MKTTESSTILADILGKRDKKIEDLELAELFSEFYGSLAHFITSLPNASEIDEFIGSTCRSFSREDVGIADTNASLGEEEKQQIKDYLTTRFINDLETTLFIYNQELLSKDRQKNEIKKELNKIISKVYNERAFNEGVRRNPYLNRILIYLEYKFKHFLIEIHEEDSQSREVHAFLTKKPFKNENKDDWTLFDIWMLDCDDEEIREFNYQNVIDKFLVENGFITKSNKGYEWKYVPNKAKNRVYTAFLVMCENRGFVNLRYTAPALKKIIENTFNKKLETRTAFQRREIDEMRGRVAREETYTKDFKSMPEMKLEISSFRDF